MQKKSKLVCIIILALTLSHRYRYHRALSGRKNLKLSGATTVLIHCQKSIRRLQSIVNTSMSNMSKMYARVASALCKIIRSGRGFVCTRQLSTTASKAREMEVRKETRA